MTVHYYRLCNPKIFQNGNGIEGKSILMKTSVMDNETQKHLFVTADSTPIQKWFFAHLDEVEFMGEAQENWSQADIDAYNKNLESWL